MKFYYLPPKEQVSTQWSGGTSTQLAIYPFESDFRERNFIFRISTATTTDDHSTFTSFPGYQRVLMVLEGTLHLFHTNQYDIKLKPFESDHFAGSWETKADGRVRDFNLIYAEEQVDRHLIEKKEISKGETNLFSMELYDFAGVFVVSGKAEVEGTILRENDFALVERSIIENIFHIRAVENCIVVLVHIGLK